MEMIVYINDVEVPAAMVFPFYQEDPFPGNYNYELVLIFADTTSTEEFVAANNLVDFDGIDMNTFFMSLTAVLLRQQKEQMPADFLLNSVGEIEIQPGRIILKGVCSDVIR